MIKKLAAPLKILLILSGLIFLSYLLVNYNKPPLNEPFFFGGNNSGQDTKSQEDKINQEKSAKINSIIQSNISGKEGQYAIFVKGLKNGQTIEYNSNETISSASIYKLAVMYKTFDALEKGEVQKDTVLSADTSQLDQTIIWGNNPNITNQETGLVSYTVSEALRLMITISDNYAALLLAQQFGWDNIETFLKDSGISGLTLVSDNTPATTASSTAQILEKIYRGQAVSKSASNEMEKLLLGQTVNDRIPKYLPQNVKVAHKTGELDTLRHDAGIVYGKKSDYIFVFLTDTPDPENASENIANLSQQIFDELESN